MNSTYGKLSQKQFEEITYFLLEYYEPNLTKLGEFMDMMLDVGTLDGVVIQKKPAKF